MDKIRRGRLQDVVKTLTTAVSVVDQVCDREQDCIDNYPENLQGTERFERMEAAVDSLNDAMGQINAAVENIQSAIAV